MFFRKYLNVVVTSKNILPHPRRICRLVGKSMVIKNVKKKIQRPLFISDDFLTDIASPETTSITSHLWRSSCHPLCERKALDQSAVHKERRQRRRRSQRKVHFLVREWWTGLQTISYCPWRMMNADVRWFDAVRNVIPAADGTKHVMILYSHLNRPSDRRTDDGQW